MKFDVDLYKVKALEHCKDPKEEHILCGFYYEVAGVDFLDVGNEGFAERLEYPINTYPIRPYTVCRNTGVKINGEYLYEFDLVIFGNDDRMGIIVWNEFVMSYVINPSNNYSSFLRLKGPDSHIKKIIGNYMLSDADSKKFQKYSDDLDAKYRGPEPTVECRSQQHINREIKRFLPKN